MLLDVRGQDRGVGLSASVVSVIINLLTALVRKICIHQSREK